MFCCMFYFTCDSSLSEDDEASQRMAEVHCQSRGHPSIDLSIALTAFTMAGYYTCLQSRRTMSLPIQTRMKHHIIFNHHSEPEPECLLYRQAFKTYRMDPGRLVRSPQATNVVVVVVVLVLVLVVGVLVLFLPARQHSKLCKRQNSQRRNVRLSVRHTPVLYQKEESYSVMVSSPSESLNILVSRSI